MMKSKLNLEEAIQIGPWRIKRKHLLFTLFFGIAVIVFGVIVLETHVFDEDHSDDDDADADADEDEDEDYDEDDEESSSSAFKTKKRFSTFTGGDWIMVFLMVAAGVVALVAMMVCILAKPNTPRRMSQTSRQASIYSVQFNSSNNKETDQKGGAAAQTNGVNNSTRASFSAPQQLPVWTGQPASPVGPVPQQQYIPRVAPHPAQRQSSQSSIHKIILENVPTAPGSKEHPPPYSP